MTLIHSLKDLENARNEARQREAANAQKYRFQIRVSMGSCGIAAGAQETLDAIHQFILENQLPEVETKIIGCTGLCALEPVVQVLEVDRLPVTYGKVLPSVVQRIFHEHIEKNLVVLEYVVDNI